jgi:hypothetical protein
MGLDRIVMLMAGKDAIRDVTAFPKAQSGGDPLTGAPAPVDEGQLRELGLQVIPAKAEQGGGPRAGPRIVAEGASMEGSQDDELER